MIRFNFLQTGGYPLETDTFDTLQEAYDIFSVLGRLAGHRAIIHGCINTGLTTTDGVVYHNGELYEFVGGPNQDKVVIVQEPVSKVFENGEEKVVHTRRYITFGDGGGSISWSLFTRIDPITTLQKAVVPVGTICMWSGSIGNIPNYWYLCDGTNNTPNLKGKFIVGYDPDVVDYNAIAKTGGLKEVTLTEEQMPVHNHTGTTNSAGAHSHSVTGYQKQSQSVRNGGGSVVADSVGDAPNTGSAGSHSHSLSIENKGGGQAHENRPPYYTMAYIMYKGS